MLDRRRMRSQDHRANKGMSQALRENTCFGVRIVVRRGNISPPIQAHPDLRNKLPNRRRQFHVPNPVAPSQSQQTDQPLPLSVRSFLILALFALRLSNRISFFFDLLWFWKDMN